MLSTFLMSILLLSSSYCTTASDADSSSYNEMSEDSAFAKNTATSMAQVTEQAAQKPEESSASKPKGTTEPSVKSEPKAASPKPEKPVETPAKIEAAPRPETPRASTYEVKETPTSETPTEQPAVQAEAEKEEITLPSAPDHSGWTQLLQKHVNAKGNVDYSGFKRDKAALEAYLDKLASNPVENTWSRNEKLAYWINVYNAYTIKLIVDNYPVKSITNLKGGKPWDVKWIKLGNQTYSLNQVENEIIRPRFKEPRIHFAVNCAAESCPPLLNKAWTADKLESYFEQQTKAFINNSNYNEISASRVQVSKIFDWYGEDFPNLIEFLNRYSDTNIKANAKVSFLEYDWRLNEQ